MAGLFVSHERSSGVELQTTGVEVHSAGDHVSLACVDCGMTLALQLLAANLDSFVAIANEHRRYCRPG